MAELQLGAVESRFADLIWEHAPVSSGELVKLAEAAFGWKRTTTHTVIGRLCDKGLFQNNGGRVTALLSREELYAARSRQYVAETFQGSLPAFLAAFTAGKTLSEEEADAIQKLIDAARKEQV